MGIFGKRKKQAKPEKDAFGEPITLGNAYQTNELLAVQEDIDVSQLPQITNEQMSNILQKFKESTYEFWYILNFHADYFENVLNFELEGEDKKTQDLYVKIKKCFRYQWLYGNCGIYKLGDRFIPVYEIKAITDANGELETIELGLLNLIISSNELVDIEKQDVWLTINGDDENYVRLHGNVNGFNAIINWRPFIQQQTNLLKRIATLSYLLNKKIVYTVQDMGVYTKELDLFLNPDSPIIFKLNAIMGNEFSTEEIGGLSDSTTATIDYYNFFIKIYYELLGRRLNVDYKQERNVSAEVDASQENYDVLQSTLKMNRKYFLNQLSQLSGIKWINKEEMKDEAERTDDSNDTKSNFGDSKE